MADQTADPLAAGYERLTVSRLGSLAFRETDADLLAIKALIEEVERLRAATVKPDRLAEAVATYRAAVKKANERQFSGSGAPEAILAGVALANAVDAILAEWPEPSVEAVTREELSALLLTFLSPPRNGGSWTYSPGKAADALLARFNLTPKEASR